MQRRLAASVLGCSGKRVWMDPAKAQQIKEAVTKTDIRSLIAQGVIQKRRVKGISRGRIRENMLQKRKGRRRGVGHRKARQPRQRLDVPLALGQRQVGQRAGDATIAIVEGMERNEPEMGDGGTQQRIESGIAPTGIEPGEEVGDDF